MIALRYSTNEDQEQIMEIYNEAVENTTATFDTEKRTIEKQIEWFENHKSNHPVIVAEENNIIKGWASLSPWSDRKAYEATVEVSVYVHHLYRGNGLGKKLLERITSESKTRNIHSILSRITADNQVSIHLHELFGYSHIGILKEAGWKFGKWIDVAFMQKMIQ